ncbi:MAG: PaaI family thioesterase [Proteobacteria bacterium]|jgi:uncharacterized protein (TIGR00369 family)|nr:PaaI family thioesterase [Pseudomonadota bacterium]
MTFHDEFQGMKASGDFSTLQDAVPYAKFMGFTVHEEAGRLITTMPYDEMLIGNTSLPALHGGTLAALLEMGALFQIAYEVETEQMPKVITITVDYMRSGAAKDTFVRAYATRVGRRVANVRAEAWQDNPDKPVAAANVNFLLA